MLTEYEKHAYGLIDILIKETLDTAESDPSQTWDDFYQTLSEDAKIGYATLIEWACGYEDTEGGEKFISTDDVFEYIVTSDKTTAESLIEALAKQVLEDYELEAYDEEERRLDYEQERADREYAEWRDHGFGLC